MHVGGPDGACHLDFGLMATIGGRPYMVLPVGLVDSGGVTVPAGNRGVVSGTRVVGITDRRAAPLGGYTAAVPLHPVQTSTAFP